MRTRYLLTIYHPESKYAMICLASSVNKLELVKKATTYPLEKWISDGGYDWQILTTDTQYGKGVYIVDLITEAILGCPDRIRWDKIVMYYHNQICELMLRVYDGCSNDVDEILLKVMCDMEQPIRMYSTRYKAFKDAYQLMRSIYDVNRGLEV